MKQAQGDELPHRRRRRPCSPGVLAIDSGLLALERTCTPSHLRGTFSTAALMAASAFSRHCCSLCDDRATLMVRLLPPARVGGRERSRAMSLAGPVPQKKRL